MSQKLPILKAEKIIRVLEKNGHKRIKGSTGHACFRRNDGPRIPVPIQGQKDIGKGLFRKILKSSGKDVNEFL